MEMGFPEGPGKGKVPLAVREATLAGKVRTRAEALKLAERLLTSRGKVLQRER